MNSTSDEERHKLRKKIMEIADRRPNFISDRTAAAIERATWKACQSIRVGEKNAGSNEITHQRKEDDHD